MQRHYSDPQTQTQTQLLSHASRPHAPQRPSRLNPAAVESRRKTGLAGLAGRGTVSMPSSPLRRAVPLPWAEPGSAQTFFGYGGDDESKVDIDPLFLSPFDSSPSTEIHTVPGDWGTIAAPQSNHDQASSDPFHLADHSLNVGSWELTPDSPSPFSDLPRLQQDDSRSYPFHLSDERGLGGYEGEPEEDGMDEDVPGIGAAHGVRRKKRQQVRVACTHCQKACKKCSNTRPCERCVKYGLEDCVDSTRKPRKTGVKRGPYKRRTSKYASSPIPLEKPFESFSPRHQVESSGPAQDHGHRLLQEQYRQLQLQQQQQQQVYQESYRRGHERYEPNPPGYGYAQDRHLFQLEGYLNGHSFGMQDRPGRDQHQHRPYPPQPPSPTLPAPRPSGLESALSAALTGLSSQPRWVNGQRIHDSVQNAGKAGTLMPHTPTVPFPLSLQRSGRGEDPFSRAVSPIRTGRGGFNGVDNSSGEGIVGGSAGQGGSNNVLAGTQQSRAPVQAESQVQAFGTPLNEGMTRHPSSVTRPSATGQQGGNTLGAVGGDVAGQDVGSNKAWSNSTSARNGNASGGIHWQNQQNQVMISFNNPVLSRNAGTMAQAQSQAHNGGNGSTWSNFNATTSTTITNPQSPGTIALKRIRKPSLRTLIVPGISREGTPVSAGPVSGNWSPGLSIQGENFRMNGLNGGRGGVRGDGTMSPTLFQGSPEMEGDEIWAGHDHGVEQSQR